MTCTPFMVETLSTSQTISAWGVAAPPPSLPPKRTRSRNAACSLKLGSGVNGHIDICHGGLLAVVLDEVMALLLLIGNAERDRVLGDRV